jgi:hypothetical protein
MVEFYFIYCDYCYCNFYYYFSKVVALILIVICVLIAFIKILPSYVDEWLHTKIIHIPQWIKCGIDINCGEKCSLKTLNNWEHQTNADIDFYSIGHIIMWAVIAYFEPKVTWPLVGGVSLSWEIIEVIMGCFGFPMHGRLTDIFINLFGYFMGASLRPVKLKPAKLKPVKLKPVKLKPVKLKPVKLKPVKLKRL